MSISTESDELYTGALDGKELFTIEGSKTGAQLQTTWRSAKNGLKKARNRSSPPYPAESVPSLLRTEMSTNSGDELSLGHLHCSRDNLSLHDHGNVHNRRNAAAPRRPT